MSQEDRRGSRWRYGFVAHTTLFWWGWMESERDPVVVAIASERWSPSFNLLAAVAMRDSMVGWEWGWRRGTGQGGEGERER